MKVFVIIAAIVGSAEGRSPSLENFFMYAPTDWAYSGEGLVSHIYDTRKACEAELLEMMGYMDGQLAFNAGNVLLGGREFETSSPTIYQCTEIVLIK